MLPTFLVIGAMKAGTTSLYEELRAQPQVFMPDEKELDFFVAEKRWSLGIGWYEGQFAAAGSAVAVGEASTNYTKAPLFGDVPERAGAVLPDVKVVYLVRHPLERMRSHWLHAQSAGWERRPFARAVEADPQYLDISCYSWQLDQWLAVVPAERVLVCTAESLRADRRATMTKVLGFLGVDRPDVEGPPRAVHATADKPPPRLPVARALSRVPGARQAARLLPERVRAAYGRATTATIDLERAVLPPSLEEEVLERLRPDVARLRRFLGAGFDGWGLA